MTTLEAIILGIVQGATEFLPVSSSGHLKLVESLLGLKGLDRYLLFDIVCHLGTLAAVLAYFSNKVKEALFHNTTLLKQLLLGTVPLFVLVPFVKPIKNVFDKPELLGYFFFITATILYLGIKVGANLTTFATKPQRPLRSSLLIGLSQAAAIFPGVSRSGTTISAARMLGWPAEEAVTFSFLLAIPAVVGAVTVEGALQLGGSAPLSAGVPWSSYIAGFLTAFGVGYASLALLLRLVVGQRLIFFVWYCLLIGFFSLLWFNH